MLIVEFDLPVRSHCFILKILGILCVVFLIVLLVLERGITKDGNSTFALLHEALINRFAIDELKS